MALKSNTTWQTNIGNSAIRAPILLLTAQPLSFPRRHRFQSILADTENLQPEMIQRLSIEVKANDGETFLINLTDLHAPDSFEVSWSSGKSWGDVGVDFTIRNHAITDESWGD